MEHEWGVFLTRAQPLHIGHEGCIGLMLPECENVLMVIGSANKAGTLRNPYDINLRIRMATEMVQESFYEDARRVIVRQLDDLTYANNTDPNNDPLWGEYLYQAVVSWIRQDKFAYYSGEPVLQSDNWFRDRLYSFVTPVEMWMNDLPRDLSATSVREALEKDDREYIERCCPASVVRRYELLRGIWLSVLADPKEDFSELERGGR